MRKVRNNNDKKNDTNNYHSNPWNNRNHFFGEGQFNNRTTGSYHTCNPFLNLVHANWPLDECEKGFAEG